MSKEDRSWPFSPFFLETTDNGVSRCSIKLPAGSLLNTPSLPHPLIWQKSLGHLSLSSLSLSLSLLAAGGIRSSDNVSGGVEFHGVENIKMRVVHLPSLPPSPLPFSYEKFWNKVFSFCPSRKVEY